MILFEISINLTHCFNQIGCTAVNTTACRIAKPAYANIMSPFKPGLKQTRYYSSEIGIQVSVYFQKATQPSDGFVAYRSHWNSNLAVGTRSAVARAMIILKIPRLKFVIDTLIFINWLPNLPTAFRVISLYLSHYCLCASAYFSFVA